ncbi:MAG: spore germination protein, partial [Halanaerobiales bacterium]
MLIDKFARLFKYLKLKLYNDLVENQEETEQLIPPVLDEVKNKLKDIFNQCDDFRIREVSIEFRFRCQQFDSRKVILAYIDGLVNKEMLNRDIMRPLSDLQKNILLSDNKKPISHHEDLIDFLKENVLNIVEISELNGFQAVINSILSGDSVLFVEGKRIALKIESRGWESRGVEEPDTESVVRGPREGFTETLRTNTSLLRRKIKNPALKFEHMTLGKQTNTDISICYIKGLIHEDIVKTLKRRLKKIKTDSILESG